MACCSIFSSPKKKITSEWQPWTACLFSLFLTRLLQGRLSSPLNVYCFLRRFQTPLLHPSHLSYQPLPDNHSFPSSPSICTLPSPSLFRTATHFHSCQHVSCQLSRADMKSKADKRDRSNDLGWITPVYATEMHNRHQKNHTNYDVLSVDLWCRKILQIEIRSTMKLSKRWLLIPQMQR